MKQNNPSPLQGLEILAEPALDMEKEGGISTATAAPQSRTLRSPHGWHSRRTRRWRHADDTAYAAAEPAETTSSPRRGEAVQCEPESLLDRLKNKYPKFDSLEEYNVKDAGMTEKYEAEATRLCQIATKPWEPVLMETSDYLKRIKTDDADYKILSEMAQTISTALSLCLLDNECVKARYCKSIARPQRLEKLLEKARVASNITQDLHSNSDPHGGWDRLDAIFKLVNYISAILARLISQTATGKYWLENVLAVLVARITKMKFLLGNLGAGAAVAVTSGEEALEEMRPSDGGFSSAMDGDEEECEEALRMLDASRRDGLTSDEEADVTSYCISQNRYRSGLNSAMQYILLSLRVLNLSGLPASTYEMCVVAYEIGFEDFKTVLYQDKDLEYSASSDREVLNTAHSAMLILNLALVHLKAVKQPPAEDATTIVEWKYTETAADQSMKNRAVFDPESVALDSMADIVTAMIPLTITSPIFLDGFTDFRTMMALAGDVKDVVQSFEETPFNAFCRLYTKSFNEEAQKRGILQLSDAFKSGSFSLCQLIIDGKGPGHPWSKAVARQGGSDDAGSTAVGTGNLAVAEAQNSLHRCCRDMDQWVIDSTSVTIHCHRYVSAVMLVALVLCGGGLGLGFTLGERITGVDPFNLATYTWVLAGFVILISKAIRVKSWAWSDFLQWRVRCHSVSELAATTRVDEQVIIAKLLHDDCGDSILQTSGPFNSVFRRRKDDDSGFSIDRPIHLATLTLSGLTLLKVVTPRGHAVVCLDHRRGTSLATVLHQQGQGGQRLVCDDATRRIKDNRAAKSRGGWYSSTRQTKLHLTAVKDFKWKRVQGLYDFRAEDIVFV